MTKHTLHDHLAKEHHISPFQTYLKEIVYGGNDGIVTTFAVVAGFTGAQTVSGMPAYPMLTVLLFGLANLFADGTSMGLGNFLSLRSEKDVYKTHQKRELSEIRNHKESEKEETIEILIQKGFSKKHAEELTNIYMTNEKYWLAFMMHDELELPDPTKENPFLTGLVTFSAFLVFGFIPLLPYIVLGNSLDVFLYSTIATFAALVLLGLLRWRVTGETIFRSVFEIVLIGGVSASIAYIVGTFFKL